MVSKLIKYFDDDKYWKSKHSGVVINLTKTDRLELDTNLELIDIDLQSVVDYVVSNGYKTILCIMRTKQEAGLGYDVPHKDTYKLFKTKLERQGIEVQEFYQQPWPASVPAFNLPKDTFILRFGYDEGCQIDKFAVRKDEFDLDIDYNGIVMLTRGEAIGI